MLDVILNKVRITGNKLTRVWNTTFDKPHNVNHKIAGINYRICTNKYTDKYDKPTICVNDSWIFKKYFHGWVYVEDTPEYKCSLIPEYTQKYYDIICDKGSFVINDIAFSNGYGDGIFPCVVRTYDKESSYYTRTSVYTPNIIRIYPEKGKCKVMLNDCNPDTYKEFTDVSEIQIAPGKIYIIKIKKEY